MYPSPNKSSAQILGLSKTGYGGWPVEKGTGRNYFVYELLVIMFTDQIHIN